MIGDLPGDSDRPPARLVIQNHKHHDNLLPGCQRGGYEMYNTAVLQTPL